MRVRAPAFQACAIHAGDLGVGRARTAGASAICFRLHSSFKRASETTLRALRCRQAGPRRRGGGGGCEPVGSALRARPRCVVALRQAAATGAVEAVPPVDASRGYDLQGTRLKARSVQRVRHSVPCRRNEGVPLRLVRARRLKRLRVSRRLPGATALRSAPRGVAVRPQVRSSRTGGAADGLLGAGLNQLGGRCGGAAVQGSARYTLQRRPHGRAVPRAGHSVARATGPRVRPSRPESGSQDQGLLCFIFSPRSGSRAASSLCARASAARTAGLWLRVKG